MPQTNRYQFTESQGWDPGSRRRHSSQIISTCGPAGTRADRKRRFSERVLRPAAAASPGCLLEMQVLGPPPALLKQKCWGSFTTWVTDEKPVIPYTWKHLSHGNGRGSFPQGCGPCRPPRRPDHRGTVGCLSLPRPAISCSSAPSSHTPSQPTQPPLPTLPPPSRLTRKQPIMAIFLLSRLCCVGDKGGPSLWRLHG